MEGVNRAMAISAASGIPVRVIRGYAWYYVRACLYYLKVCLFMLVHFLKVCIVIYVFCFYCCCRYKGKGLYAPKEGYRYDGLYTVEKAWQGSFQYSHTCTSTRTFLSSPNATVYTLFIFYFTCFILRKGSNITYRKNEYKQTLSDINAE